MSGQDILRKARATFRAARTVETLRKISVPEWETEIFYWPEMSVEERLAVYAHVKVSAERTLADVVKMALAQVQWRARDAHSNRLFTDEDEAALADTDPAVLQRISSEMASGDVGTVEDAEKK